MIGTWFEGEAPDVHARLVRGEFTVMTVGDDGMAWLDEQAPGWRDRVHLETYTGQVAVSDLVVARADVSVLRMVRDGIAHDIAAAMVEGMESFTVEER